MYKLYRSKGEGTNIAVYRGLFRTLWTAFKLNLSGHTTKIVKY